MRPDPVTPSHYADIRPWASASGARVLNSIVAGFVTEAKSTGYQQDRMQQAEDKEMFFL